MRLGGRPPPSERRSAQAVDKLGHCFRAWRRGHNRPRASQLLQFFRGVCGRFAIDVDMRAEFFGERRVFGPRPIAATLIAEIYSRIESRDARARRSPCTATRSPGIAPLCRRALYVVTPAQSSGAASTSLRVSGIAASASTGATMYS